jgi:hypothetical protein
MKHIKKFENYLSEGKKCLCGDNCECGDVCECDVCKGKVNEDGCGSCTAGSGNGMGAISAPQASSTPGDVAGSTRGSGDRPAYDLGKRFGFVGQRRKRKSRKKNESIRNMYVTKFSDWEGTGL